MHGLITDLEEIRRRTKALEDEHVRFRQFLKYQLTWSDRRLDALVHRIAAEVSAAIDCTACANCCRALEISLEDDDLARLADHLRRPVEQIAEEYATPGAQCERAFAHTPCAFLAENRCTVYPARPRDCRDYPHLHKPHFRQRMWFLLGHAEDCPIVFNVLERLRGEFAYRRE